ncbi:TonB-dependent receptor domain-containing protein [Flavobacterium johnsoniae]|uniref:TonB-dependent receptor n=1 Tax=Flavobacterium johnsoniae (strain ATCC 17061 / DSM 2064 / JCM 8514 / BCRC 14874 / CCUG 350202 / NBRC 14942 / NCIMB 11054 / UW101) TaxID=376686 RepID=A5FAN6_FLAJ1|nr:TonB-dependent receptor [Flavobacterium johnsoniae]ABQ07725.1 TonB-dependent receptor [Flavobacterium johnsoniae UW101]OXG01810.1 TonB-dependent receptor [Flavobacterium johnsoniae UW101]WQG80436.1 TonB-dependent receptor [Flavobacterium johnsoniae UW101]SHL04116.1 Outer membrane receptor proteins, mostly Fe transport [Flavobacterium johnsoniae]
MEKWKQNLIAAILLFAISQYSFSQKTNSVTGTISDGKTPLEFVDVVLKPLTDTTKTAAYAVTDSSGKFVLENINSAEYILKFRLIGFKSNSQKIKYTGTPISLGNIVLQEDANLLNTVVVNSQKKQIQKTNEGFVFNAVSNISQTGGTAIDMLKNIPTVAVDADDAISLRGKTPLILINGKNSAVTNMNQIPASSIESIEIITSPTAKYDANAESGIINIKLKKNNLNGLNGAAVLGGGFGAKGRMNSSVLLNNKTDKWNIGLAYDNRFAGRTKSIKGERTNYFIDDEHFINQSRSDERTEGLQNLKLNVDFSPNDRNTISFEALGNMESQDNDETLKTDILNSSNQFYSSNKRHSLELERSKAAEFAFNYDRKFSDDRKSLTASITTSYNFHRENTDIDTDNYDKNYAPIGDTFWQRTHNYEKENISNAIVNYAFTISEKSIIETGYKGTFRLFNSDFQSADLINGEYVVNPMVSNIFDFNEQINAVYVLWNSYSGSKENQKWKYNLGLRAENVSNNGATQNNSDHFSNDYLKIFPSGSVQLNLKSDEFLKFGYSKRINRPDLDDLNPFIDITDALNPHGGNPYLKPEIIYIVELSYNKDWDKYSLSGNAFYRNANNTIRQYGVLQDNGVILLQPQNIGNTVTYGLETIFSFKPISFYDGNISLTAFQQNINAGNLPQSEDVVSSAFSWYGKIINNFTPWKGGKLQVIGNYNSAVATAQGKRIPIYNVDMGFQQKLGKSNARLGLVVTDMFNTLESGYKNNTLLFRNNRTSKSDTRALMLTFAYTFRSDFKEKLLENQFSTE